MTTNKTFEKEAQLQALAQRAAHEASRPALPQNVRTLRDGLPGRELNAGLVAVRATKETPRAVAVIGVRRPIEVVRRVPRKLYMPQNPGLYDAALSGFVGGVNQARANISGVAGSYAALEAQGQIFAQAVDALIAPLSSLSFSARVLMDDIAQNVIALQYPQGLTESGYAVVAGVVVALWNATYGNLTDSSGGGPTGPSTPVLINASIALPIPTVDTSYYVESSAPITVTMTGAATNGVTVKFYDASQNWVTYPFTFAAQAGWTVRNPYNISGADAASVTFGTGQDAINGQSVAFQAISPISKWLT